jgi:hypothetical protein
MAVLSVALFALIGLVVDSGRAIAARSEALTEAQQAARVGAGQISVDALRSGQVQIDPGRAESAGDAYLASVGQSGTTSVVGQTVIVQVVSEEPTVMLGIVGINQIKIEVSASAVNVHGVTEDD